MRIATDVRTGSTGITGITMIPRKTNKRRRNIEATAVLVKAITGMTTTGRQTSVVGSMGLAVNIDSIGINDVMTRAQMMTATRNHTRTNSKHLAITDA